MNTTETQITTEANTSNAAKGTSSLPAKRVNLSKADLIARGKITVRAVYYPKSDITLLIRNPRYERKTALLTAFNDKLVAPEGQTLTPEQIAADNSARSMTLQKALMLECVLDEDGAPLFDESDWQELCAGDGLLIAEVSNELLVSMAGGKVKEEGNASAQT